MSTRLFLFIGLLLLGSGLARAQETPPDSLSQTQSIASPKDTVISKNPTGAMLRSIFVPGLGQFYNGKWLKGIVIAGTEVGLIANAVVLNQWANESETDDERYFYLDNRNLSFWLLGATILYSMADAYVDAHLYDFDDSPDLAFYVKKETEPLSGLQSSALMMQLSFQL
jgi:hypothetical protein